MSVDRAVLEAELRRDEGIRTHPYVDTGGVLTIGVGRNLSTNGLRPREIDVLLRNDIDEALADCESFPWWTTLTPVRQRVVCNMRFNLGPVRFRGFTRMLDALVHDDYERAADEMLHSKWATQVGARAVRLAQMMRTGKDAAE